ncbi:MAG TPA: hypothetical protein VIK55_07385 [Paludibacter sp.]
MEFFDSTKSIIENAYYLSGVLILISLIITLSQVLLAKKTLEINSKREAAKLAVQQIELYLSKITPLQDEFSMAQESKNIPTVVLEQKEFSLKYLETVMEKSTISKLLKERSPIVMEILNVLNAMEAFSVYFVKGVADEEIAYSSVGGTFVFVVKGLFFDIATSNEEENGIHFQNLIKLYKIWNARLEKENLTDSFQKIKEQLNGMNTPKINPIGVKK